MGGSKSEENFTGGRTGRHRLDAPHVLRDAPHERLQVGPRVVVPQVGERLDVQLVVGLGKSV